MAIAVRPSSGQGAPPHTQHGREILTGVVLVAATFAIAFVVASLARPTEIRPAADDTVGRFEFAFVLALTMAAVCLLDRRARRPVLPEADIFVPTGFIVTVFGVFALTWLVYSQLVLDAFARDRFGYLEWLTQATRLGLSLAPWNVWTPYPQGSELLIAGTQLVGSALGSLSNSDVWSSYTFFRLGFVLVFLVAPSVLLVWLTGAAGRALGRATATIATLALIVSFGVVYYGVASAYVTDPLPVALSIAALVAVQRGSYTRAGLAVGFGAVLKLFPALLLPVFVLLLPRRSGTRICAVAAGIALLVLGPFFVLNPAMFASPLNWQSSRPPWESWYAYVDWSMGAAHDFSQPYFEDASAGTSYGWVFTGITPKIGVLQTPVPPGPPRWENNVSALGTVIALLLIFAARRKGTLANRSLMRWCLYAFCSFFFFAIGWSPQYELYLIPLILLSFDDPFTGAGAALLLQAVTFADYPLLLPWATFYGGAAVWLDWAAILARYLVLGWLALYVLRTEASFSALRQRVTWLRPVAGHAVAVVLALAILVVPDTAPAQTSDGCGPTRATRPPPVVSLGNLDWPIPSGWFFTESGDRTTTGFSITDDSQAQMWSEFNRLGGWQVLGFPASQRFTWRGQLSQATQRAVLQWSPITGQVEFANVLDLMHDEGRDDDLLSTEQIPPPVDVDEAGLPYETIAANRLAWLDERAAIKAAYCNAPGGGDPLQLWGLPTSRAENMSQSGGEVYVLRTQRAAFQEWVDGAEFAAPGSVTVVLAGDLAKEFNLLPPAAVVPQPAR
ncbi:MAG: DUF2029 domain-containing protein [Chloroflexi bacterium]|nr:DUF2029 domain-containing protein [Chloroflexota bacterium]